METAKIFENGRSQAVRLPKKFRFNTDEVIVQQLGDAVILVPKESMWQTFMDGLNSFTDDIFEDSRDQASMRSVNICDVYAGHQHLHLRDEKQTGACIDTSKKGAEQRRLHFFHHACRTGVWNEA